VRESGTPVSFGVLFGSQARGVAGEDSDIDVLIVSSHFDGRRDFDEVKRLWELTADIDPRVEPIPVGEREWTEDDSRAIVEIARREGLIIDSGPASHETTNTGRRPSPPEGGVPMKATRDWGPCSCECGRSIKTGDEMTMFEGAIYLAGHEKDRQTRRMNALSDDDGGSGIDEDSE